MKYKFEYLSLLSIQFIIKYGTWNREDSLYAAMCRINTAFPLIIY